MNLAPPCLLLLLLLLVVTSAGQTGTRIIGGVEVDPFSIKYQASLLFMNYHFCGGTLISSQWVVTAAHCWRPTRWLQVVLSEHRIDRTEGFEQRFRVSAVIKHYHYQHWTFDNDIMLLKLDHPATINSRVQPALLPYPYSPPLADSARCTVSGWGLTSLSTFKLSPVLRSVDVGIINRCWEYYYFRITNNMICAGSPSGGKDSCMGDSGGPLICNGRLEGIVSWGIGCANPYYPGVYTKVSNYLGWIDWVIRTQ